METMSTNLTVDVVATVAFVVNMRVLNVSVTVIVVAITALVKV